MPSQEKEIKPSNVAPNVSRERNARMPVTSIAVKQTPPKSSARFEISARGTTPIRNPLCSPEPTPNDRNASGRGLAIGRSTIRVVPSRRRCEY